MQSARALPACVRCGAPRAIDAPLYCTFCGAKQATGVSDPAAYRTIAERYDLVAKQPGYGRALGHCPRLPVAKHLSGTLGILLSCLLVGWLIGVFVDDIFRNVVATWIGWGVGAFVAFCGLWEGAVAIRRLRAPTLAMVAVITHEKDDASGAGAGVSHHVTVQLRDKTERRAYVAGELIGTVISGDIGLAYLQHDRLLDFRYFDVMPLPLRRGDPPRAPSCTSCAAPMTFDSKTHCTFCNAPLASPDLGEHGARFAELLHSPHAATAARRRVRGGLPGFAKPILWLAIAAYLDGFLGWVLWTHGSGDPGLVIVLGALMVAATLYATILFGVRLSRWLKPRRTYAAMTLRARDILVDKQQDEYKHHVTIAAPNGARRELRVMPKLARGITPGSFGVAHVRGRWLVGFDACSHEASETE